VWWHYKPKTRPRPTGKASDIAENSGEDDRGADILLLIFLIFEAMARKQTTIS
jgi:hypothetical protein